MRLLFSSAALALLVLGCSGSDGSDEGDEEPIEPIECSPDDRVGTYLIEARTRSGNCGEIPSQIVRVDDPIAIVEPCTLDSADRWSDEDCTLERSYTCVIDPATGQTGSYVGITTQRDSDGDRLTGTLSVTVRDSAGTVQCIGTYNYSAVRQ